MAPVEDAIRAKVTDSLNPAFLEIHNISHLHAHHQAMQNNRSTETHFKVFITSDAFKGKPLPARHRMVYGLLKDEMGEGGSVHALQLRTWTVEEGEKKTSSEK